MGKLPMKVNYQTEAARNLWHACRVYGIIKTSGNRVVFLERLDMQPRGFKIGIWRFPHPFGLAYFTGHRIFTFGRSPYEPAESLLFR